MNLAQAAKVDDLDLWAVIETPVLPTDNYADIANFEFGFATGTYYMDLDAIQDIYDALIDALSEFAGYELDSIDITEYTDGTSIAMYGYANTYSWSTYNESEAFGCCIGPYCQGFWA